MVSIQTINNKNEFTMTEIRHNMRIVGRILILKFVLTRELK